MGFSVKSAFEGAVIVEPMIVRSPLPLLVMYPESFVHCDIFPALFVKVADELAQVDPIHLI